MAKYYFPIHAWITVEADNQTDAYELAVPLLDTYPSLQLNPHVKIPLSDSIVLEISEDLNLVASPPIRVTKRGGKKRS
jgi:hypothetical protein